MKKKFICSSHRTHPKIIFPTQVFKSPVNIVENSLPAVICTEQKNYSPILIFCFRKIIIFTPQLHKENNNEFFYSSSSFSIDFSTISLFRCPEFSRATSFKYFGNFFYNIHSLNFCL